MEGYKNPQFSVIYYDTRVIVRMFDDQSLIPTSHVRRDKYLVWYVVMSVGHSISMIQELLQESLLLNH